jgi:WD40 repeat protein
MMITFSVYLRTSGTLLLHRWRSGCLGFLLASGLLGPLTPVAGQPAPPPYSYGLLPVGAWACLGSPRFVAGAPNSSVAFSPDGKLLATGTREYGAGTGCLIHIWDLATGAELHRLRNHLRDVKRLIFTADSKRLVSAAWDNTIRVWDLTSGKEERQFKGHTAVITGLELTADNKLLISSSQDGTIRVWDFARGEELRQIKGGWAISPSPDGRTLVTGAGLMTLWDIHTGEMLRQLDKKKDAGIGSAIVSPDGKLLAAGRAYPHEVILWDVEHGAELLRLKDFARALTALAFSRDGKMLATGSGGYKRPGVDFTDYLVELKLWSLPDGKLLHSFTGHTFYVNGLAFSPDNQVLASASGDFSTRLWDVKTGRELDRFIGHGPEVTGLAFTPGGQTLCSSGHDGTVRLWDAATGQERSVLRGHTKTVWAIALTPDGKTLASGGVDGAILLWDLAGKAKLRALTEEHRELSCLAISPDGQTLASGDRGVAGSGGSLRLWDWREGEERRRFAGQEGAFCAAYAADGQLLAVGFHPRISVWNVATGAKLREWQAHGEHVDAVGYLPGGFLASVGTGDRVMQRVLRLWDADTGTRVAQLAEGDAYRSQMAVSPDGRLVAVSIETAIHVFEACTRRKVGEFHGHRRHVSVLAFHPDGRTLATGGADGGILFWDLTGHRKNGKLAGEPLTRADLAALWQKLADPIDGRRALWRLALAPEQAVPFLRQQLPAIAKVDPKHVRNLIADLDSDDFATRDLATRKLGDLQEGAAFGLERALTEKPSPEVAARVKKLLSQLDGKRRQERASPSALTVQMFRAVEALERTLTPAAQLALRAIAEGEPSASLTQQARAALERLALQGK